MKDRDFPIKESGNIKRNLNLHVLVLARAVIVVVEEAVGVRWLDHLDQNRGELALQSKEALGEGSRRHLKKEDRMCKKAIL